MTTEAIEVTPEVSQVVPETAAESTPAVAVAEPPDEELIASLKESGFYSGATETPTAEGDTPSTEEEADPVVQAKVEAALEKKERATQQKTEQQLRQLREQGIRESFANRKPQLAAKLAAQGLPDEVIREALSEFDAHHGQILELARSDLAMLQARQAETYGNQIKDFAKDALTTAGWKQVEAELPKLTGDDATPKFFKAVVKAARVGYLSEAEANKKADERVLAYAQDQKRKGNLSSSQGLKLAAGAGNGSAGGIQPKSAAEAHEMYAGVHASGRTITLRELRTQLSRFQQ